MSARLSSGYFWRKRRFLGGAILVLGLLGLLVLWWAVFQRGKEGWVGPAVVESNRELEMPYAVGAGVKSNPDRSDDPRGGGRWEVGGPKGGLYFNGRHLLPSGQEDAKERLRRCVEAMRLGERLPVLLGFQQALSAREERGLRDAGFALKGYVPAAGYLVQLTRQSAYEDPVLESLTVMERLGYELKVDPVLGRVVLGVDEVGVRVHVWSSQDVSRVAQLFEQAGFGGWQAGGGAFSDTLVSRLTASRVAEWLPMAAALPEVIHVEPAGSARVLNNNVQSILQSGAIQGQRPFFDAGVYGSNQVIAICDTGIDLDSCYFRDSVEAPAIQRRVGMEVNRAARKVIAVDFWQVEDDPSDPTNWDEHGHGTMVAGCAGGWKVGLPYSSPSYHGMAPGAQLVIQDCGYVGADVCADLIGLGCPVTNFLPVLKQAYAQGARIHNNSWGDRESLQPHNWYSEPTRELDWVMWENRDFLVVCAAGNDGLLDMVDSPSVSKNGLSVGATGNGSGLDRITSFSSRGWASDGRWKPDLVAPGESIISAASDFAIGTDNCGVTILSGTSFSSPAVAGMAALVRDYFAQGFYPYGSPGGPSMVHRKGDMSAALVKGILIQSTVPVVQSTGSIPARDQGWGRVNLSRVLPLKEGDASLWVRDEVGAFGHSAVGSYVAYLRVRSTNEPLKVTLVWTDPPATVAADFHLVNDLDLHLRSVSGIWSGNQFRSGWSVEGGVKDGLNNVERILIPQPGPGIYVLEVEASRIVPQWGDQDFALVVNGDVEVISGAADEDGDGMADGWEMFHWRSLDRDGTGDADGDGMRDVEEYGAGSDPWVAGVPFSLSAQLLDGGVVELEFVVSRDRDVTVEFRDELPEGHQDAFEPFENAWVVPEARLKSEADSNGRKKVRILDDFTRASSGRPSLTGARYYRLRSVASALP